MSTAGHPETTARHALWFGGILVVLAGLFGMHGLDSHGAAGMDTTAYAAISEGPMDAVAASGAAVRSDGHHAMETPTQAGLTVSSMSEATGSDATDMGMAGMCMAILVGALITLVRPLRASRFRSVPAEPARPPWLSVGRSRDPPSLIALSILRC